MKFSVFLFCFNLCTNSFSQNAFSETDAKNVINIFFEGFHKGDRLLMKSVMAEKMIMQTAYTDKNGSHNVTNGDTSGFINAIKNRKADQKWD